ncbi:MAG TPA: DNA-3-methyladenine glycosylase [Vicinamibacterales bacterium]
MKPQSARGSVTRRSMTPDDYARARRLLMRRDPRLRAVIAQHGRCGLADGQRDHGLQAMIESIVWQQLSGKAAATIYGRFLALFPTGRYPTPQEILAVPLPTLRQVGLSTQKSAYIRDVCERVSVGTLDLDRLESMGDEEVIASLTQVKGIGRWTAEMFLMFRLHRPDVLPVGDLGIVKAIQRLYGLRKPPSADKMLAIGRRWQPYRSVASWYLWASLEMDPPGKKG